MTTEDIFPRESILYDVYREIPVNDTAEWWRVAADLEDINTAYLVANQVGFHHKIVQVTRKEELVLDTRGESV